MDRGLDPYADLDMPSQKECEAKERREALQPLNLDIDCPEGFLVNEAEWNRLQELRFRKIESELELKKQQVELKEMEGHLKALQKRDDALAVKISEVSLACKDLEGQQRVAAVDHLVIDRSAHAAATGQTDPVALVHRVDL